MFHFRFELCKKLGQGTYGKVQLGINKETGQRVSFYHFKNLIISLSLFFSLFEGSLFTFQQSVKIKTGKTKDGKQGFPLSSQSIDLCKSDKVDKSLTFMKFPILSKFTQFHHPGNNCVLSSTDGMWDSLCIAINTMKLVAIQLVCPPVLWRVKRFSAMFCMCRAISLLIIAIACMFGVQ